MSAYVVPYQIGFAFWRGKELTPLCGFLSVFWIRLILQEGRGQRYGQNRGECVVKEQKQGELLRQVSPQYIRLTAPSFLVIARRGRLENCHVATFLVWAKK